MGISSFVGLDRIGSLLRSPRRIRAAFVSAALCLSGLMSGSALRVGAQGGPAPTALTVLVADFTDSRVREANKLSLLARDAVAGEMANSGQAQFRLVPRADVLATAKALGMRLPKDTLKPADLTTDDWFRLARALKADALVTGYVVVQADRRKGDGVQITVLVRDSVEGEPLNGGQGRQASAPREGEMDEEAQQRSVSDAALGAVRQMLLRPVIVGTILNARQGVVTLNRGNRDGLKAGDELRTFRYGRDGVANPTGRIRVTRTYEDNAEARPIVNNGIGTEDVARKTYRPAAPGKTEH